MPAVDKEALTIEPWAAGIGLAMMVVVVFAALFTAWGRAHTGEQEVVITPTAVGDMHFVQEPAERSGPIGVRYHGQMLDMVSEKKIQDSKLIREGSDDSGNYPIYRLEDEGERRGNYFVKAGVNKFMEVTPE